MAKLITKKVSEKANTDDVWLAPYVGYIVTVVEHENGDVSFVLDDAIHNDMEDYMIYLEDPEQWRQ